MERRAQEPQHSKSKRRRQLTEPWEEPKAKGRCEQGGSRAISQEPHPGFKSCFNNLLAMLTLGLTFPICKMGLIYFLTKRKTKGMGLEGEAWFICSPPILCLSHQMDTSPQRLED